METPRFEGRTVIVTGAGSGIGRATAVRLAAEGARVVANDVSGERLDQLAAELGDAIVAVPGDVTQESAIGAIVDAAGPRIDGLANIAGVFDGALPTAEIDDATWDRVMAVNVTGVMRLTRAVIPVMLARHAGSIVSVSSEAGIRGSTAGTAYTASKWAVNGFTLSTAFFYTSEGIRCNAIAPGPVATNISSVPSAGSSEHSRAKMAALAAMYPPVAQPEQLAAGITWLLSDDASYVSGVVLPVDLGMSAI